MIKSFIFAIHFFFYFSFFQLLYGKVKFLHSMTVKNPELGLTATQVIKLYNYSFEEHTVSTQDGYFIKIQRIIKKNSSNTPKFPVLLMHGLNCLSTVWIDNCNASLGFVLANESYDVWLGNVRGNPYGMEHLSKKYNSKEFWDFSFHEHAVYDLPSIIDCILSKTGFQQLYYVGHSMGTTMMFVLLSTKPDYNSKIKGFMAFAPVAYLTHAIPKLKPLMNGFNFIRTTLAWFNVYSLVPTPELHSFLVNYFCRNGEEKCEDFIHIVAGNQTKLLNKTRIPLFLSHTSVGASLKTISHYKQIHDSHNFTHYDYGSAEENMKYYKEATPPFYDLSNVTAPVALFWSPNDKFTDYRDFERLRDQLPNVILNYTVPYKNFTHLDFLWAMNSSELIYKKTIQTMELLKTPVKDRP